VAPEPDDYRLRGRCYPKHPYPYLVQIEGEFITWI
jgi:hypothetical protein